MRPHGGITLVSAIRSKIQKPDANATSKELLPATSKAKVAVYIGDDLARVPELHYDQPPENAVSAEDAIKRTIRTLMTAEHLDSLEADGFVKALAKERPDFAGLPFLTGKESRSARKQARAFHSAANAIRQTPEANFWPTITKTFAAETSPSRDVVQARTAALLQIAATGERHHGLVQYLAGVVNADGTRELARLAVFSPDAKVREDAIVALAARRERDYTDVLLSAMRYPLPSVAARATDAVVKLERKDLLPHLVELLEGNDPRLPFTGDSDAHMTHEVVRINHHRNCVLCHAQANPEKVAKDVFVAEVPLPTDAMPSSPGGYQPQSTGLLVRVDVTYLRADFSALLPVEDATPWPEMQRYDFVVRKRSISDTEAKELRDKLTPKEQGELTPYQRAAVKALRELTGRDLEAKGEVWRKFLKLPLKPEPAPPPSIEAM